MPNFRCSSCGRPISNVGTPGGCECPERDLRELLARERQKNNSKNNELQVDNLSPQSGGTPDLAGLLMSSAGRREFEAAQQLAPRSRVPMTFRTASQAPGTHYPPTEDIISDEPADIEIDPVFATRTASTAAATEDLAAMWMQGTGIPYDPGDLVAPSSPNDGFEFDTGELGTNLAAFGGGPTTSGPRYRVDGPPPNRRPFDRGMVNDQGPTREVARVGRGGRFALLRPERLDRVTEPVFHPAPPREPEPRPDPNARQFAVREAKALQERARVPSIYERLRGPNPFNDV